jgi:hypothetical protein
VLNILRTIKKKDFLSLAGIAMAVSRLLGTGYGFGMKPEGP